MARQMGSHGRFLRVQGEAASHVLFCVRAIFCPFVPSLSFCPLLFADIGQNPDSSTTNPFSSSVLPSHLTRNCRTRPWIGPQKRVQCYFQCIGDMLSKIKLCSMISQCFPNYFSSFTQHQYSPNKSSTIYQETIHASISSQHILHFLPSQCWLSIGQSLAKR